MVLLPALNPACSSAMISSAWGLSHFQDDFQHDFARMIDEADSSVVLAELQVVLFRECNNLQVALKRATCRLTICTWLKDSFHIISVV